MAKHEPLLGQLRRLVRSFSRSLRDPGPMPVGAPAAPDAVADVAAFGPNPGNLRLAAHVPRQLAPGAPLVVVLHGCGQTAQGYAVGTGWTKLADRLGFALALPEQRRENNPRTCFNWFVPADVTRDQGEVGSIRQMVEHIVVTHGLDRARIFVTGLSAGGAMATSLLATYPDIFAAGAVIAGLPHGSATSVDEALKAMLSPGTVARSELGDRVRRASTHRGPWPRIAVWHGGADKVVRPGNGEAIIRQWTDVHGVPEQHGSEDRIDGHRRRLWLDAKGRSIVEAVTIEGLGHGAPIEARKGGAAQPFILEAGIHSTHHIARFFGLGEIEASLGRGASTLR